MRVDWVEEQIGPDGKRLEAGAASEAALTTNGAAQTPAPGPPDLVDHELLTSQRAWITQKNGSGTVARRPEFSEGPDGTHNGRPAFPKW